MSPLSLETRLPWWAEIRPTQWLPPQNLRKQYPSSRTKTRPQPPWLISAQPQLHPAQWGIDSWGFLYEMWERIIEATSELLWITRSLDSLMVVIGAALCWWSEHSCLHILFGSSLVFSYGKWWCRDVQLQPFTKILENIRYVNCTVKYSLVVIMVCAKPPSTAVLFFVCS